MKNYILFYFTLLIIFSFTYPKSVLITHFNINKSFSFTDSFNVIYLENNNNEAVHFQFKINNFFPLEMQDIVHTVEDNMHKNGTSIESEAWKYISNTTFWSTPITSENWQHNPILFLNSIGGGFCDDRASVLAQTWKNWFDSVRVIDLNGHVVSEVQIQGKWKMYDSDRRVAYLNANNDLCSVSNLEDSSQFISNPTQEKVIGSNAMFQSKNKTSIRFSKLYTSKDDNKDVTSWHLSTKKLTSTFILPAYSTLKIEIDRISHQVNISVILTHKSKGKLQIPFVPYSAEGIFDYQFEGISNSINDSLFYFPTNKWINSIDIDNVKSSSTIRYLVNPKLKFFQKENTLKLESNLTLDILKKQETIFPYLPFGFDETLLFDETVIEYDNFIAHLNTVNGIITPDFMIKEYDLFLNSEESLSKSQKENLRVQFPTDLKTLNLKQKGKEYTVMKNLYPQSVLFFFIAAKERKLDMIKSIIMKQK